MTSQDFFARLGRSITKEKLSQFSISTASQAEVEIKHVLPTKSSASVILQVTKS